MLTLRKVYTRFKKIFSSSSNVLILLVVIILLVALYKHFSKLEMLISNF